MTTQDKWEEDRDRQDHGSEKRYAQEVRKLRDDMNKGKEPRTRDNQERIARAEERGLL